jgi:hypothetical protein
MAFLALSLLLSLCTFVLLTCTAVAPQVLAHVSCDFVVKGFDLS